MNERNDARPLYQAIYDFLLKEIREGRYGPDQRVPSEKELAVQFGVSRITSKRALELLADHRVIRRVPGKGSFVLTPQEPRPGRQGAGGLIGVVLADFGDSFGTALLYGLEDRCRQLGYHMVLYRSKDIQELEVSAVEELRGLGVRGLVIMPVHGEYYSPVMLQLVLDRFPLVFVDRHLQGLEASFVGIDNVGAAKRGVDYLFDLGHRVIAFLSPRAEHTSTIEDRIEGFVRSHAERGIAVDRDLWITGLTNAPPQSASKAVAEEDIGRIQEHLGRHPSITAVFADEYNVAVLAREASKRLGRRVPEDLSILCFDCPPSFAEEVAYSHLRQPEQTMGSLAIDLLNDHLSGSIEARQRILQAELIIGKSTNAIR